MRYRIITAEALGGYFGYLVQQRGDRWYHLWRNRPNIVYKTLDEAEAYLEEVRKAHPLGKVIFQE